MGSVKPQPGKYRPGIEKCNPEVTARHISEYDTEFKKICDLLGTKPSIRQARDYRRKLGKFTKDNIQKFRAAA